MYTTEFEQLISRYLNGKATFEEEQALLVELQGSPERKALFKQRSTRINSFYLCWPELTQSLISVEYAKRVSFIWGFANGEICDAVAIQPFFCIHIAYICFSLWPDFNSKALA